MSILARLTVERPGGTRGARRRRIRLDAGRLDAADAAQDIVLHDLAPGGCAFADRFALKPGAAIRLRIPEIGEVAARVTWVDGERAGCAFAKPLSQPQLAAALATSPVIWGDFPGGEPAADPLRAMQLPMRGHLAPVSDAADAPRWPHRLGALAVVVALVGFWVLVAALV